MKKIIYSSLLLILFLSKFSAPLLAQNKTKAVVKLPTFVTGQENTIDKPVIGDLMVAGGQNKIITTVSGDAYVAGGQINIGGTISGNLIVLGGEITISGNIGKNLIIAGGQVTLDDKSSVAGYVLTAGGQVDIQGKVMGPVKVGAGSLVVGTKAIINGNLEADVSQSNISETAKISGTKNIKIYETKKSEIKPNIWRDFAIAKSIFSFLSKLLILLIFVRLFGQSVKPISQYLASFWSITIRGLILLFVTPFLSLILFPTLIGIPLSLLIMTIYFIAIYISQIVVALAVGKTISINIYLQGSIGLLLLTIVGFIPFIGGLTKLVVLLFGLGIISQLKNNE
ncbi:MAG: hypothetical protein WC069_04730 [Candidatus Shapirobacteria bacterium]